MTDSIACPSCPDGRMRVIDGWETKYALRCDRCPEYFYGGRGMFAIGTNVPADCAAAFTLLERAGDSGRPTIDMSISLEERLAEIVRSDD